MYRDDDVKPGWKSTEFWSTILAALAPWISSVPADKASAVSAAAVGAYAIARALTKRPR